MPSQIQSNIVQSRFAKRRFAHRICTAFTVLELLVTIAIIGLLIGLLLPALMSAREAARRSVCTNQLRQIGLAMSRYHDEQGRLPAAWSDDQAASSFAKGWATELLAELEEPGLARLLKGSRPSASLITEASANSIGTFLCPSDFSDPTFELRTEAEKDDETEAASTQSQGMTSESEAEGSELLMRLPTANYVGVYGTVEADEFYEQGRAPSGDGFSDGAVVNDRRVDFADLRRGLSHTLLAGERKMATVPSTWLGVDLRGEDAECRLVGSAITRPNCETCDECEFTSRHPGGANFLWADGHVALLADDVDSATYRIFAKRSVD